MENFSLLILLGFFVGTLGTLVGAGGGFVLVPVLILAYPHFRPEIITAISMAVIACNAFSGSLAYARAGRIDYRSGIQFALFTIPGSILGVILTKYISVNLFHFIFSALLIILAVYLFVRGHSEEEPGFEKKGAGAGIIRRELDDRTGEHYAYSFNVYIGWMISIAVGFISPVLGIGGGIIHVPALVKWLNFPVHIATATSHFILVIMSVVSVIVHFMQGNYRDPQIQRLIILLATGVVLGAQLGAYLSSRIKGEIIVRALAIVMGLVGFRILLGLFIV